MRRLKSGQLLTILYANGLTYLIYFTGLEYRYVIDIQTENEIPTQTSEMINVVIDQTFRVIWIRTCLQHLLPI